ncbi:YkyA family protein [Shouchella lonarensis]|uniref:Cell-wall binding lipoprotein n=1 Tax=Shouchella lonarensis TaxID=1464122 RepID=A0A1G6ISJ9_9BACI|nr:YkyA family protein [Shouchella lonarensis]SDC09542.1 Putative cell-wall binding lipoprotein [Shouchella lonarensis]
MAKSRWFMLGFCFLILFLSGCGTTKEKVQRYLDDAAREEQVFQEQQQLLKEAEEAETKLYEQLLALEQQQYDQSVFLADQAVQSVQKRRELVEKEKESVEKGYEVFEQAVPLFKELNEEQLVVQAKKVREAMEKRYDLYMSLHETYGSFLDLTEKLYHLLQEEEVSLEMFQVQVEKVAGAYEELSQLTDRFNEQTDTYNEEKKNLYKIMQ